MKHLVVLFCILLFSDLTSLAQYNFYYGNIHSHTDYSDGNKDSLVSGVSSPGGSFAYAKNSYHIDFWGISEHNHFNANNNPGMLLYRYAAGLYQADTSNQNGNFVAMYGIEFGTISTGGHLLTYGVPGLIGWENVAGSPNYDVYCAVGDYVAYWNIVKSYPNTFTTMAHPQSGDYNDLLVSAPFNPAADTALVGTAIRSGNAFSTTENYSDQPATMYETEFCRALAKGYHTGPTIDHDNHYTTFGRTNKGRTVVLASVLDRDSIIDAFKNRRFYASDDWNAEVHFTLNGNQMGSIANAGSASVIDIQVNDLDVNETVSMIQLWYGNPGSGNMPALLTEISNSATLHYTHSTAIDSQYYYYAKITQGDGDIIWTSPIWIHRVTLPLSLSTLTLTASTAGKDIMIQWSASHTAPLTYVVLEHSYNDLDFNPLKVFDPGDIVSGGMQTYTHQSPGEGTHYYRLKVTDVEKHTSFSDSKDATIRSSNNFTLYPNPAGSFVNLSYTADAGSLGSLRIYDGEGRQVIIMDVNIQHGQNHFYIDTDCLPAGQYYLVLQKEHERLLDTRFLKE